MDLYVAIYKMFGLHQMLFKFIEDFKFWVYAVNFKTNLYEKLSAVSINLFLLEKYFLNVSPI